MKGRGRDLAGRLLLLALIIVPSVGCDQATKGYARAHLVAGETIGFLGGGIQFVLTENQGGFLGLGDELPAVARRLLFGPFVALALVVVLGWLAVVRTPPVVLVAGGFAIAGGIGNLIDRMLYDRVTDFILLRTGWLHTGIFNVADVLITVAIGVLLVRDLSFRGRRSGDRTR